MDQGRTHNIIGGKLDKEADTGILILGGAVGV